MTEMNAWSWLFVWLVPAADTAPMTKALNGLTNQVQIMQAYSTQEKERNV